MNSYEHLIGIPYKWGVNDCYTAVQRWYKDVFDITLNDYVRPKDYGSHGIDLYMDNFRKEGFRLIDIPLHELQVGDGFLMSINATVSTHAAIYVGNNSIFHHYTGLLSSREPYKGIWRNTTVAMVRHPEMAQKLRAEEKVINLVDIMPPSVQEKVYEYERTHGKERGIEGALRTHPKIG